MSDSLLKQSGASGVVHKGNGIQIIYGPQVSVVKSKLEDFIDSADSDRLDEILGSSLETTETVKKSPADEKQTEKLPLLLRLISPERLFNLKMWRTMYCRAKFSVKEFFSVGTNDLTQYTLACDRQNPALERFCDTHHEAVLRLIEYSAKNAHENGAWIGICGELAADTTLTETFLQMGIDELSVSPPRVLNVRSTVRKLNLSRYVK